jgi:hypothetical protein
MMTGASIETTLELDIIATCNKGGRRSLAK